MPNLLGSAVFVESFNRYLMNEIIYFPSTTGWLMVRYSCRKFIIDLDILQWFTTIRTNQALFHICCQIKNICCTIDRNFWALLWLFEIVFGKLRNRHNLQALLFQGELKRPQSLSGRLINMRVTCCLCKWLLTSKRVKIFIFKAFFL